VELPAVLLSVTVILGLVPLSQSVAQAASVKDNAALKSVLVRIQRHYQATDTFSAKFKEEISPVGAPKRIREGTVYFHKPGRMRWEFTSPEAETIVSDGDKLYSYEPDLNQVVQAPLKQAVRSNAAVGFLLGIGNIQHDFDASVPRSAPRDGSVHLSLTAKTGGDRYQVVLDPVSYDLKAFTITDQLGDVTVLNFNEIRDNPALDDSLFAFKAPPGADIVNAPGTP
jgi:outer membrane lipoprotein carrier protein